MMDMDQLGYFLYMDQQEKKQKLQVNQKQDLVSGRTTPTQNYDNFRNHPIKVSPTTYGTLRQQD